MNQKQLENQIYGEYSSGTGFWLSDEVAAQAFVDPFSCEVIDSYITQVSIDLDRLRIFDRIKDFHVLDIGSGRQAIAFSRIGALLVNHFDISKFNVDRFVAHLKSKRIENIFSQQCDLVVSPLPANKFDLVYAHGVVQHTSNPYRFISNLINSTRPSRFLWLYWYQHGSPIWLYYFFARYIIKAAELDAKEIRDFLNLQQLPVKFIDGMLDSFLCTHLHLIPSDHYLKFISQFNVDVIYSKDLSCDVLSSFRRTNQSALVGLKKSNYATSSIITEDIDFPTVDPFNESAYCSEDRETVRYCRIRVNDWAEIVAIDGLDKGKCLQALQLLGVSAVSHNRMSSNAATHKKLRYCFDACVHLLRDKE